MSKIEHMIDGSFHTIAEIAIGDNGLAIRVTALEDSEAYGGKSLRMHMKGPDGKVWPGPEFPLNQLPEFVKALIEVGLWLK